MKVEEGLLFINDIDMATLGVFLCETEAGGHKNYDALMGGLEMKEQTAINYAENDGEELPDEIVQHVKARDIQLTFAIVADNATEWLSRHGAFRTLLLSGWLNMRVPELNRTFKCYTKSMPAHSQMTLPKKDGRQIATMTVVLREPKPGI